MSLPSCGTAACQAWGRERDTGPVSLRASQNLGKANLTYKGLSTGQTGQLTMVHFPTDLKTLGY
ncbi:hypothetical protein GCM10010282_10330 [Streptomyces roseolus]|nr:hypothetical protein GCM10010282_10330 [Streptomyces roseolus]